MMIRKKREELGLTQELLAHMADVSIRTVQRAEKKGRINIESLKSIAAVLDIPWDLLVERDEHLKKIQEEFSKQAPKLEGSSFFRNREIVDTMLRMGGPSLGRRVLDLACGPGILTEALYEEGWKVTAVDITKEMLDIVVGKKLGGVEVVKGDANKLIFKDKEFQGVFTRLSLHHFKNPQDVMEEMRRVTADDGSVVVGDIISIGGEIERDLHNAIEKIRDASHMSCLSKGEVIKAAEKSKLKLVEYRELEYERELEEWTNISGREEYETLYTILKYIAQSGGLRSLKLREVEGKIYFTHTWGFFKFKKMD